MFFGSVEERYASFTHGIRSSCKVCVTAASHGKTEALSLHGVCFRRRNNSVDVWISQSEFVQELSDRQSLDWCCQPDIGRTDWSTVPRVPSVYTVSNHCYWTASTDVAISILISWLFSCLSFCDYYLLDVTLTGTPLRSKLSEPLCKSTDFEPFATNLFLNFGQLFCVDFLLALVLVWNK